MPNSDSFPKSLLFSLCTLFTLFITTPVIATHYYLDNEGGVDSYNGTSIDQPWQTIARLNKQKLYPGDVIFLKRNNIWDETLSLSSSGSNEAPIRVMPYGKGDNPILNALHIQADNLILSNLTIDHNKQPTDAVIIRDSSNCQLQNMIIRNGARDGIDISDSNNIKITNALIHHFLAGSFKEQLDGHGIVVSGTLGVRIKNTEIHHVSGDSFQSDPARNANKMSNQILIEDSHFWTGPLKKDFNAGWVKTDHLPDDQKQYPGENAIDTKVVKSDWESVPRMHLTINNLVAHGWQADNYIKNKAALNLKEKVEVHINGLTLYDNEIALRIRGRRGNANVTIKNALIYQCRKGIRAEDNLRNLKLYNSTFGAGIGNPVHVVNGKGGIKDGRKSWIFMNNIFPKRLSRYNIGPNNFVVKQKNYKHHFVSYERNDYRLKANSWLREMGLNLQQVKFDIQGKKRTAPYDVGAFEYSDSISDQH